MDKADVFDLAIYDQFQKPGYQQRVKMGEHWATLPTHKREHGPATRIDQVKITTLGRYDLADIIEGRYRHLPFFEERWNEIHGWIMDANSEFLWEFNFSLILRLRDYLGIETPISISKPLVHRGTQGLLELCHTYGAGEYVSGMGGRQYMGDTPAADFRKAEIDLLWSNHKPRHGESILRSIFELESPLDDVLRGTVARDFGDGS